MFNQFRLSRIESRFVLMPIVVLSVLTLSAYLAPRASLNHLLLLLGAGGVLVFLHKPELGLIALLIAALSVPFAIGTGTQTSLHAAILLIPVLLAVWVADMIHRRTLRLVPSLVNAPLIAFAIGATISFLAGNLPWNYFADKASLQAQMGGWAVFVLSAAVFLLMANQITDLHWLKALTGLFLALGAVVVIGRVLPPVATLSNLLVVDRAQGSLFWVWLVALSGGQAFFNRSLGRTWRLGLAMLALAVLGVGWFQGLGWASGWMPEMVALGALLWLRSWRLGLLLTAVGVAGVLVRDPDLPARLVALKQYSIDTRLIAWQIVLGQVIQANPVIGLGPANYYHYTPLYPILGWYVKFNSHNQYVDIVAQLGIVGLALFAWLMLSVGRLGWGLRERVDNEFARGYVYGCLGGLAGTLVAGMLGDWFLPFVYNIGLAGFRASMLGWLFLGGLVAIEQITLRRSAVSE